MEIIAKSQVLTMGPSSLRGSSDESFSSESEFGIDVWEGLIAFDFAPEEWRPRRPWDAIDDEDMEEDRHLKDILGETDQSYTTYEMLADSAKISILGSLRDEGIYRPWQTVIQPETVARANTMLNNHHDYETIRNLIKHAVEEDALGLSPFSKADPIEALRLLQRFRSWAVPNLRFDRYVLKTDKGHPSLYGIDAYLRDAMVLLAMKQLWDNNQYLEWQPDIHPAAIRQSVAFAGEIGRTATTELVRAFHTRLQIATSDPKDNFFPRSPCQRRKLVARFFCGPQKCKVFQVPGSPEPVGDISAVDDKSTMRRVRFAEPQEDPRRDFKLYPLRKMTKQYGLSMHTVKRLTAFMHQRANVSEASHP